MNRWPLRLLASVLVLAIACVGWCGWLYRGIDRVGEQQPEGVADVIIVLGAAVWPTGPSPALLARIDRAVVLYHQGRASHLIMSGGPGQWPPTEAEAMAAVAASAGVPPSAIVLEDRSTDTEENLRLSRDIMRERGWTIAIIVTDPFHVKRATTVARDLGITAIGAPATDSILWRNSSLRRQYTWREVLALTRWYLVRPYLLCRNP